MSEYLLHANTTALAGSCTGSSHDYCTSYSYDNADHLTSQTDPAGNTYQFFYAIRGNLRGVEYPNTTFSWINTDNTGDTSNVYNRHGTITSTTTTPPSDSNPLADYTYTYLDGSSVYQDGKKVSELRKSGSTSQTTTYTYDNAGRLNQVLLPNGTCRTYNYDLDSNRTQTQEATTGCSGTFTTTATNTYDPTTTPGTDQLTKTVAGSTTNNYAYTSDGQTSNQGTTTLNWNGWGRLKTATVAGNTITYAYDPNGDLITRASSSSTNAVNYVLGGQFETNAADTITTSYTEGPAGNLASYNGPPTSTSTVTYLYYDAHGNLAAEANSSGTQTANHTYDPFGAPNDSVQSNTTVHRFVGRWDKQYDTTTGDILMGARPYDTTTGRFLTVDPIPGGSLNNYDYGGQDPVSNYDLSGRCYNESALNPAYRNTHVNGGRARLCWLVEGLASECAKTNPGWSEWRCFRSGAREACGRLSGTEEHCLATIWRPENIGASGPVNVKGWIDAVCAVGGPIAVFKKSPYLSAFCAGYGFERWLANLG